jgi:hypothetical protein
MNQSAIHARKGRLPREAARLDDPTDIAAIATIIDVNTFDAGEFAFARGFVWVCESSPSEPMRATFLFARRPPGLE